MEENILKYFTGTGEPTTETIMPQYISSNNINVTEMFNYHSLVDNTGNYYIRYGGASEQNYKAIEIYSFNSLDNGKPLYVFDNIKISGSVIRIVDLKQDEDGRFYGIGWEFGSAVNQRYLILFNNFIQDKECMVRKYYTFEQIGITNIGVVPNILKKNNQATYYILDSTYSKIYAFTINIQSGNRLDVYNYNYSGSIISNYNLSNTVLYMNNDNLIYMIIREDNNKKEIECSKLIINTSEVMEESYSTTTVYTETYSDTVVGVIVNDFKFRIVYKAISDSNYNIKLKDIDLSGESKIYNSDYLLGGVNNCAVSRNYIIVWDTDAQFIFLFVINNNYLLHFKTLELPGSFEQPQIMTKYNLVYTIGINSFSRILSIKTLYSQGYSSIPYYNSNFLIPQYINLYGNVNDDTSVIFSRDASNRFLAGNQLTTVFNVPNYMLNNSVVQREDVLGQTNLAIESNNIQYNKNRFESLYLSYMYNIYVKDNTNGNNLSNMFGANRIATSLWNLLDYQDSPLAKVRVTYEDGLQDILSLNITNVSGNSHTFEYEVSGDINKIEYLSNDEETVYATYRCNLSGRNTVSQTITVEEG